jgi:hypothetical protein
VTRIGVLGTLAVTSITFIRSARRLLVRLTYFVRRFLSP